MYQEFSYDENIDIHDINTEQREAANELYHILKYGENIDEALRKRAIKEFIHLVTAFQATPMKVTI